MPRTEDVAEDIRMGVLTSLSKGVKDDNLPPQGSVVAGSIKPKLKYPEELKVKREDEAKKTEDQGRLPSVKDVVNGNLDSLSQDESTIEALQKSSQTQFMTMTIKFDGHSAPKITFTGSWKGSHLGTALRHVPRAYMAFNTLRLKKLEKNKSNIGG